MKKQLILGGTILISSMALHMPSAMAYSSNAEAFADFGNSFSAGDTNATATFGDGTSTASVDGFTLHSYSEVSHDYFMYEELLLAPAEIEIKVDENVITGAVSSFTETFTVTAAGAATLSFVWDGTLSADAGSGLTAGYEFAAAALDGTLADSGENVSGTGDTDIDSGGNIALFFTAEDVGTTFDVDAYLYTYISDDEGALLASGGMGGFSAIADFSNTASFSFTGGIAAVPVPAAVWLLGSALMGLVGIRRRTA